MKSLVLRLFIFVLLIVSQACADPPDWARSVPRGYENEYKLCQYIGNEEFGMAEQVALQRCIKEISLREKLSVDESSTEVSQVNRDIQIKSRLKYQSDSIRINGFQVREKYLGFTLHNEKEVYLLVSYPKKGIAPLPSMYAVQARQMVFPGWGELYIGETYKGQLRIFTSSLFLAGAVCSYFIMADAYRDARTAKMMDDQKIYREKAGFYKKWCIGFSITYVVHSLYSAIDVHNSDYLRKYL